MTFSLGAFPLTTAFWFTYQLSHIILAHCTSRVRLGMSWRGWLEVASALLVTLACGMCVDAIRHRATRLVLGTLGFFLALVLTNYLLAVHVRLDPAVTWANWTSLFSPHAASTVLFAFAEPVNLAFSGAWMLVLVGYWWLGVRTDAGPNTQLLAAAVVTLLAALPFSTSHNEMTGVFAETAKLTADVAREANDRGLALVRSSNGRRLRDPHVFCPVFPRPGTPPSARPSVIVLMLESFNATFINEIRDGVELTPVMNRLLKQGLTVRRFYGNSVQTSRGQFSVLFGVPPVSRIGIFDAGMQDDLYGLPQILGEAGYATVFLQAYQDLAFEGTKRFQELHGFGHVEAPFTQRPGDEPYVWGWGPEDQLFYRDAFERLDALHATQAGRPIFAVMATISSHMRFRVPEHRRTLYREPENLEQRYLNALHLSDAALDAFIQGVRRRSWLADAIVVITGDHSFPSGRHGVEFNEVGIYEESFLTPFVLSWPRHIEANVVLDVVASQLDIAPTLLDLLDLLPPRHHFYGDSLFAEGPRRPVPLVQPYNGEYLGAVQGGLKLLRRSSSGEELVYDLNTDPGEERALDPAALPQPLLAPLRATLAELETTRDAIRRNEVWRPQLSSNQAGSDLPQ